MNRTEHRDTKKADTDGRIKTYVRKLLRKKGILVCVVIAGVLAVALVWRMSDPEQSGHCLDILFGTDGKLETIKLLGTAIGAVALFWNAVTLTYRATAQDKTAEAQKETADAQADTAKAQNKTASAQNKTAEVAQQDVERQIYNDAVRLLGDTRSASARIAGSYALADFAASNKERKQNICNSLCAHVRETTQQADYQETYKDKPSNEIQSLLDVLTKGDVFVDNRLDFSRAYLRGAHLERVNLSRAILVRANLSKSLLAMVNLDKAIIIGINLSQAILVDIKLGEAQAEQNDRNLEYSLNVELGRMNRKHINLCEAKLLSVTFEGMNSMDINLSGAYLSKTSLKGMNRMHNINLSGADLSYNDLSEVDLPGADLRGTMLMNTNLKNTNLKKAQLQGAYSIQSENKNMNFHERINSRRGKGTDLRGAKNVPANINEIADTGILTDEMADEIIRKYDEAIGENKE